MPSSDLPPPALRSGADSAPSLLPSDAAVPSKVNRTAVRVLDGEALVLVIDRRELHRLNGVGTRILELCDGKRSVAAIAQALVDEFEVEPDAASADVKRFVSELLAVGALSIGAAA